MARPAYSATELRGSVRVLKELWVKDVTNVVVSLPRSEWMKRMEYMLVEVRILSFQGDYKISHQYFWGARWLSGRVSDSGARGRGIDTYRRRVVSLSKTLHSPKVLVDYPGSIGSVPT